MIPNWSIARVVAHFIVLAQFSQQSAGRALRGDSLPPSLPGGQRFTPETFRARSTAKQEELSLKSRSELLTLFDASGSDLVDLFRRMAPHNMTRLAWTPAGTWTLAMFVSMRVFELGLHGWDIHAALDSTSTIRPRLLSFLLGLQMHVLKRYFQASPELDGLYRFDLGSVSWMMDISNGKIQHRPMEVDPDSVVRTDVNNFLLLATGRRTAKQLESRGLLNLEGDVQRTEALLKVIVESVDRASFRYT